MSGGLLLLLAAPAHAGWVEVSAEGECAPTHPDRHRIEVVRDTFKRREDLATIEDQARERAVSALLASVCAGRSADQCDVIRARVGLDVAVDMDKRFVCAAALVASEVVADPDGKRAHDAAIAGLVDKAASALRDQAVGVVTARWSSGCGAGEPRARLATALRAGLLARGVKMTDGVGERLVARLIPGEPVSVELWRYPAGRPGEMVGSARLSSAWLGLAVATMGISDLASRVSANFPVVRLSRPRRVVVANG